MISMDGIMAHAVWATERVNTDTKRLAIKGYDSVAYLLQGKPLKLDILRRQTGTGLAYWSIQGKKRISSLSWE
jgi:hypothetical protein